MSAILPPVELWSFRSLRASVSADTDVEIPFDFLADVEEALVIDVSYSTEADTDRHAIRVEWFDPTNAASRKVIAQTNDNAVFWNPVRWFVPRIPGSTQRWVLRARCSVPTGTGSLDVSVAIVRSLTSEDA